MYKYKHIGEAPTLLIEHHKEIEPGGVVEVESPLNSAFFIPVEDEKKQKKEAASN